MPVRSRPRRANPQERNRHCELAVAILLHLATFWRNRRKTEARPVKRKFLGGSDLMDRFCVAGAVMFAGLLLHNSQAVAESCPADFNLKGKDISSLSECLK